MLDVEMAQVGDHPRHVAAFGFVVAFVYKQWSKPPLEAAVDENVNESRVMDRGNVSESRLPR